MAEEKKRSMIPLVISVMLFVVGLILGYYIWGLNREEQVDYKGFLQETINYIATMEHKNKRLIDEVDRLETEVNMLQQKQIAGTTEKTDQLDALSQRITSLERENQDLKASIAENARLAQENQELRQKIEELMSSGTAGTPAVPATPEAPAPPQEQQ